MENYITNELIESTYLFCAKRISDSEAAKDLSQDILLTAIQNINAGKSFVSFNSWYWKMAHNKYADLVEARRKNVNFRLMKRMIFVICQCSRLMQ